MTDLAHIAEQVTQVQAHIAAACAQVGRDPTEITLVAVSKTHPPAALYAAYAAGLRHFGENRLEEAQAKIAQVNAQLAPRPTWHMIGHIQSRKTKFILPLFDVVHSVDSLKLAQRLAQTAHEAGQTLAVFLEINISGEAAKDGLRALQWQHSPTVRAELWATIRAITALPTLAVRGLMTMAPFYDEGELARPIFRDLAQLQAALRHDFNLPLPDLSMGMTNDYAVAIHEGATVVRIGRAIFGERAAK
jgi:hypothetical protein